MGDGRFQGEKAFIGDLLTSNLLANQLINVKNTEAMNYKSVHITFHALCSKLRSIDMNDVL